MADEGIVYVLSNEAMPGLLKRMGNIDVNNWEKVNSFN